MARPKAVISIMSLRPSEKYLVTGGCTPLYEGGRICAHDFFYFFYVDSASKTDYNLRPIHLNVKSVV